MYFTEIIFEQQQPPQKTPPGPVTRQVVQVPQNQNVAPVPNEASIQPAPEDYEYDEELDGEDMGVDELGNPVQAQPAFPQEILPLKRYHIIQKLKELKNRLTVHNIYNDDLDIVVKFSNSLTYNSLVMLVNALLPVIEDQIVRLNNVSQQTNPDEV